MYATHTTHAHTQHTRHTTRTHAHTHTRTHAQAHTCTHAQAHTRAHGELLTLAQMRLRSVSQGDIPSDFRSAGGGEARRASSAICPSCWTPSPPGPTRSPSRPSSSFCTAPCPSVRPPPTHQTTLECRHWNPSNVLVIPHRSSEGRLEGARGGQVLRTAAFREGSAAVARRCGTCGLSFRLLHVQFRPDRRHLVCR
jgi:hypothetical protein